MRKCILTVIALLVISVICISTPVLAIGTEEKEFYITEETTQWDVVKETNPNHDEIPDEIKEQMMETYVMQGNKGPSIFVAIDKKQVSALYGIVVGVLVAVIILAVIVIKRKMHSN